jgi:hypothetical protein
LIFKGKICVIGLRGEQQINYEAELDSEKSHQGLPHSQPLVKTFNGKIISWDEFNPIMTTFTLIGR